jgi:hypothetical protein
MRDGALKIAVHQLPLIDWAYIREFLRPQREKALVKRRMLQHERNEIAATAGEVGCEM